MKNNFILLKSGAVIYCSGEHKHKSGNLIGVYGYNLSSPYLKQSFYKMSKVDRALSEPYSSYRNKIHNALQSDSFYFLKSDNKNHSAKITRRRLDLILNMIW